MSEYLYGLSSILGGVWVGFWLGRIYEAHIRFKRELTMRKEGYDGF